MALKLCDDGLLCCECHDTGAGVLFTTTAVVMFAATRSGRCTSGDRGWRSHSHLLPEPMPLMEGVERWRGPRGFLREILNVHYTKQKASLWRLFHIPRLSINLPHQSIALHAADLPRTHWRRTVYSHVSRIFPPPPPISAHPSKPSPPPPSKKVPCRWWIQLTSV